MDAQQLEKMNRLALDIMKLSRNTLQVNLRFLDLALSMLQLKPDAKSGVGVDGKVIHYHPMDVLKSYKAEKEKTVRNYFHMVLHCVFRHMYVNTVIHQTAWDLACDIAVENIISELNINAVKTAAAQEQTAILTEIRDAMKVVSAEKVYVYLTEHYSDEEMESMQKRFYADDHSYWYCYAVSMKLSSVNNPSQAGGEGDNDEDKQSQGGAGNGDSDGDGDGDEFDQTQFNTDAGLSSQSIQDEWKEVAERMMVDMETFSKRAGQYADGLVRNLKALTREKYDYTAFLKKFAVLGETMKINDDEFDYIFYTYGLELYESVPLIEPLEYKEEKRIKEFVIAIDTSGSVDGKLVQIFLQKTFNILKSAESFFTKINVHIIQCDALIHEDAKITSQEEFDNYIKTMKLHGFGGTDFRPVFTYVDALVAGKEFKNLKGLIYFTDGYGDFPKAKPAYNTAFVFVDDEVNNYDVPPWAMKLILPKEDIMGN